MLLVARKNLFSEKMRLLISVGGVALSVFLITLLLSLYRGWDNRVGGWIEESGVDLWLTQEGTDDFLGATSLIPVGLGEELLEGEEVASWSPLMVRQLTASSEGREMDVQLIGYEPGGLGGPLEITEGPAEPGPGEAIVDEVLSSRFGVDIGDSINVAGRELTVVGTASGSDFLFWQAVFVQFDEALDVLGLEDLTTFFVMELREPAADGGVAAALTANHPELVAIPGDEFASATREKILGELLPIILVVLILSFIVGLAIAGLTIYTATVEKAREYGILKAVGFTNGYLYRTVIEQSVVTGMLGFVAGTGLTLAVGPFSEDLVPQFVLSTQWLDVLGVAVATLIMVVIASYVPVRRIAVIDPVAVFRA